MVMTRSGGCKKRRNVKGSSSYKCQTFDQEGLTMDPIDVEPLSSAPLRALMPYRISKDYFPVENAPEPKDTSPIKSQNSKSPNLANDHV